MPTTNPFNDQLPLRVRALRSFTWALLIGEWLVSLAWPPVCLLLLYFSFVLWGGLELVPKFMQTWLLAFVLIGMVGLVTWRWPRLLLPQRGRIDERLMLAARFRINPFAAMEDRPAQAIATAQQLWQVAGQQQQSLWPRLQRPKLRPLLLLQDPRALRYLALLSFGIAYVCAGPQAFDRLYLAVQPGALQSVNSLWTAPQFTLTLTPPAFTGQNTRIFNSTSQSAILTVPQGTKVITQLQGGFLRPRLLLNNQRIKFTKLDNDYQTDGVIQSGDAIAIYQGWREVAYWPIHVATPEPPNIVLGAPQIISKGRFTIPWSAKDFYGLQKIAMIIQSNEVSSDIKNVIWSAQNGQPENELKQNTVQDLAAHRLAGKPVKLFLEASNTADLSATTSAIEFTLPERHFKQPLAQELANLRQALWVEPKTVLPALTDAISASLKTELVRRDTQNYLALQSIYQQLQYDHELRDNDIERINIILWRVAVRLEEGATADYAQNLQAASAALEAGLKDSKTTADELERLTTHLQNALQDYLANAAPPENKDQPQQTELWDQDRLQQEMQALKDAWQAGSKSAALAHLQQLQAVLQNAQTVQNSSDKKPGKAASQLDPLGRPVAQTGMNTPTGIAVPLTNDMRQQSKAILNELRMRANTVETDPQARDYYQRLLQLNN